MTRIQNEILIKGSHDCIGRELFRVETFPEYMEDVKEVRILERNDNHQISSWRVNVDGIELQWIEEDRLFLTLGRMEYRLIQGDFEKFEGVWSMELKPATSFKNLCTKVQLSVDYDLGLPTFEELIGEILKLKVQQNSLNLLKALKKRLEKI